MNENCKERNVKDCPECTDNADYSSSICDWINVSISDGCHGYQGNPHSFSHIVHVVIHLPLKDLKTGTQEKQREQHADCYDVLGDLLEQNFKSKDEISLDSKYLTTSLLVRSTLDTYYNMNNNRNNF